MDTHAREITSHRKPRSARARRTSLAVAGFTAAVVAGGTIVGLAPGAHASSSDNAGFLGHLNSLRAAHGLPALSLASDLSSVATAHAAAMSAQQTIFHNASLTSEIGNWQVLGENVGMGGSVSSIDSAFDASPEHYANEVSSAYTQVGIGTAWDSRGYLYVTLDFRKPLHSTTAPVVTAPVVKPPSAPAPPVKKVLGATGGTTGQAVAPRGTTHRSSTATSTGTTSAGSATAATGRTTSSSATGTAAKTAAQAPASPVDPGFTIRPVTPTGSDPVASALAFSRLMAQLH